MDEVLIELVREHEIIYNHGLPEYRDQVLRQVAWEDIGRELQMPGNKAKERWDNLRRCFWNARSRRRDDNKNAMTLKKKAPWRYEQQMAFILPFSESRKAQSNLNDSQASVDLAIELEDPLKSEPEENSEGEQKLVDGQYGAHDNQTADDEATFNDAEKCYKAVKLLRHKKQKLINTPAHQMIQILKENSALRKRKCEELSVSPQTSTASLLQNLDDTDMFFLSMSRMTKQLPKVEQAQIKLGLSNSVLSAEVRYNRQLLTSPTPNDIQPMISP